MPYLVLATLDGSRKGVSDDLEEMILAQTEQQSTAAQPTAVQPTGVHPTGVQPNGMHPTTVQPTEAHRAQPGTDICADFGQSILSSH